MSHPERIVPDETEPGIVALHEKRYRFALSWCDGRSVLDAACGVGYGAALLAEAARSVVGVDLNAEAIAYARRRYARPNVVFDVADVTALPARDASFDVVCSFETIEHVAEPERFLAEIARVLRPDGTLIVSSPRTGRTTASPANPYHRHEWSAPDFERLLRGSFADVELYGQRRRQTRAHRVAQRLDVLGLRRRFPLLRRGARLLGTAPTAELTLADIVIARNDIEGASEVIAVCRGPLRP